MPQCPRCEGKGWIGPVHINRGDKPHEWRERIDCDFCQATGQATDDQMQAAELGKKFRERRVAREESLMEASKRLGMRPSQLSRLERGVDGMAAWHHPFATTAYLEATG